jgi:uncharacterized membrane protein
MRNGSVRIAAPLHAILVHFTVALSATSLGFDLAAVLLVDATLADAGWWTIAMAALLTIGTVASGLISRLRLAMEEGQARRYLRAHMALGPIVFGLLVAVAVWRAMLWERATSVSWIYLITMAAVMLVITVQGYLGGELVYRFGAEVQGRFRSLPTESQ